MIFILVRIVVEPESILGTMYVRKDYVWGGMPIHQMTPTHSLIHIYRQFIEVGRKPENVEEAYTITARS